MKKGMTVFLDQAVVTSSEFSRTQKVNNVLNISILKALISIDNTSVATKKLHPVGIVCLVR